MDWTKVTKSLGSAASGSDDAAVPSRRDVLAGIGVAGVFVVAGSTLLAPSPAEARVNTPATEPGAAPADAARAEVGECELPNLADLDTTDVTEFSAQWRRRYWRRRYWRRPWRRRYWRRPWRRRYWRRGYRRVVCRRRWFRGRLVRVCRRVW
jgi:hypothetical protein